MRAHRSDRHLPLIPIVLTLVMMLALSLAVIAAVKPSTVHMQTPAPSAPPQPTTTLTILLPVAIEPPTPITTPPDGPVPAQLLPTATPVVSVTASADFVASPIPISELSSVVHPFASFPSAVALSGIRHEWQTWNNCGPATLAMLLSYYGSPLDQATVGGALRLSPDDKNVSPEEMARYAHAQGFAVRLLVNGNAELLRALLSNGFPVLLETWHEAEPNDGMGHYRLATGYDHEAQEWLLYDSYDASNLISAGAYQGIRIPYEQLDAWWKVFNRTLLLVYPRDRENVIAAILAQFWGDSAQMWQQAVERAWAESQADPSDVFAWFNLGSSLTALGRFAEAATAFDRARTLGLPWRMLWYQFAPFQAYLAVGRAEDVLTLTGAVIVNTMSIEEVYYWRGRALAALGDDAGAQAAYQRASLLNPAYKPE